MPRRLEKTREDAQVVQLPLHAMLPIDMQQLDKARREASNRGVSVIKILEETSGHTPDQLVAELGRLLRMPLLTMENLHALTPAFEILSFTEAVTQECALFRQEEKYILAVGNPFSRHFRAWAEDRIDVAAAWHLVHPADHGCFFYAAGTNNARNG